MGYLGFYDQNLICIMLHSLNKFAD